MRLSKWFYIETKSFEFALKVGISVLRIFERSRGYMCYVSLGKASILRSLPVMEEVLNAEVAKEFLQKSKAGSKVFFVQRSVNRSDLFWSLANMAEEGSTAPSSFQRGVRGKGGLAGCSN
jgi:hypothetical protein